MQWRPLSISWTSVRNVLVISLVAIVLIAVLAVTGVVTSPFGRSHVRRVRLWFGASSNADGDPQPCHCMWRIGCPKFAWQVNFTSPKFNCGYEPMTTNLVTQCLDTRATWHGRQLRLHVLGHAREAFLVDYLRRRLQARATASNCNLYQARAAAKDFDAEIVDETVVTLNEGQSTCAMNFTRSGLEMDYMYFGLLGPEVFQYVEALSNQCETEGCAGDLLIISGGVGELLNSTLIDSFRGVRRFQRQFEKLLPLLIQLKTSHRMEVVWKIHEPVTDELIPDESVVRNDLFQEYNALIMEQALGTPLHVWTSHMLMKLHHIEECEKALTTDHPNSENWRCEEELVAGDLAHAEYFDAIFNFVCDKQVEMPENPCCSA